jgi:hypothetical protein
MFTFVNAIRLWMTLPLATIATNAWRDIEQCLLH